MAKKSRGNRAIATATLGMVVAVGTVLAGASTGLEGIYNNGGMKIAYVLLGVSLFFTVAMILYIVHILIARRKVKKQDKIKEILKEAKMIEEKIKGEGLTSITDIVLSQVLYEIRNTRSEIVSLILFSIGILFSLTLAIIAMLFTI